MKIIEIDLKELKTNHIEADVPGENFKLDFLYNTFDGYMYMGIIENTGDRVLGHTKLVPNIDYLNINKRKTDWGKQLRIIKVNEFAEEKDKITPENFSKDYKLFLIGEENEI